MALFVQHGLHPSRGGLDIEQGADISCLLVDSGADGTIVPMHYLIEIHAPPTREMIVRSQWGDRHPVMMYLVDVQIGDLVLSGIEVVGDEISDEPILGRDILNRLRVLLDGPRETVEVSE